MLHAPLSNRVASLLRAVSETEALLRQTASGAEAGIAGGHLNVDGVDDETRERVLRRLRDSVIRPLEEALAPVDTTSVPSGTATDPLPRVLGERLWELARRVTTLRVAIRTGAEVKEATAALQDLAMEFAAGAAANRLAELRRLHTGLEEEIEVSANGPYLVTNVDGLDSWLGERIAACPQTALCRCGASAIKPRCDGSHARIGFTGAKDANRVPDRRDTYAGVQATVLDNRGTCAHSGFCSDRLSSVFHAGSEPFVTPSGARMDDIVRAVRSCPSGSLSYAIDGHEQRSDLDRDREPAIEVSKDGPYRIAGGIRLVDAAGNDVPRNEGASREHYSLCRCGHSQNKPFCSGMHWYVNFHDPLPDPDRGPTLFEWAGGLPALSRMTRLFYEKHVPADPLIGPLFADMTPDHPERVTAWLGEVFGGPASYSDRYGGYSRMLSQHVGRHLTEAQRARWAELMRRSADEAGLPTDPEWRAAFVAYIEWGSRLAVENSQGEAHPPPRMPVPRWWWVCDATPGARVSGLAPAVQGADEPVPVPGPDETVSFARHIKPMFRPTDRESMRFAFDLWSYEDVRTHADGILERLANGTMPCDGGWPADRVEVFRRWVGSATPD
jgi:CDGSH-type Zn-finger protein/truncated hemoglobin YjbI